MNRLCRLASIGMIAATAAGCASPAENGFANLVSAETRFPIRVEPQIATLVVQVDTQGVLRGEEDRVRAFAEHWKSRGHGALSASMPAGTVNHGAAKSAMARINRVLSESGVDHKTVRVTTYRGAGNDGDASITLSFMTYAASAPDCGMDWSENMGFNPRNLPWPEFGCATQHNFAVAVSDPRDLTEPRPQDSADAMRRATVLQKHRAGTKSQTEQSEQDSGKIATVE
ncbi:MAG: CpaD family pilus assembly protein [Alphaproteobacteria bacterium]|nr:CpaD family pilus assembly protein [Alphaproteobacteria bacterium]